MTGLDRRQGVLQGIASDGSVEREVTLAEGALEIGRRASGFACPGDDQMADRHARLDRSGTGFMLEDLGLGSGVWLRVRGGDGRRLASGDQIWVGAQILAVRREGASWQIRHHGPDGRFRAAHDVPENGFFIGRTSDLTLDSDDAQLSRRHAQIAFIEGELRLFDRGAHNGTYLRLRDPEPIEDGSEFRVATQHFRFEERVLPVSDAGPTGGQDDPLEAATVLNQATGPLQAHAEPAAASAALQERSKEKNSGGLASRRPRGLAARLRRLGRGQAGSGREDGKSDAIAGDAKAVPELQVAPAQREVAPDRDSHSNRVLLVIDSASGSVTLEVEAGKTVLEAVQEAGLARGEPVDWECGDGGCGVCILGVVEGADRIDPPDPSTGEMKTIQITEQVAPDPTKYRLACLAKVRGTVRLRKLIS